MGINGHPIINGHTVSLPGKRPRRREDSGERALHLRLVESCAAILGRWRSSAFEFEASCRHGFRTAFCLTGESWARADAIAAVIVREALHRLGARRPTWDQGQPEYCEQGYAPIERIFCMNCGRRIPDDRGYGPRFGTTAPPKFCSDFCVTSFSRKRVRKSGERQKLAEYLARHAARTAQTKAERGGDCAHCGKHFETREMDAKYCSRECRDAAVTVHHEVACLTCGRIFKPKNGGQYCSRDCSGAAHRKPPDQRICAICGTAFTAAPSSPTATCSPDCRGALISRTKRGEFHCEAAE